MRKLLVTAKCARKIYAKTLVRATVKVAPTKTRMTIDCVHECPPRCAILDTPLSIFANFQGLVICFLTNKMHCVKHPLLF